MVSSTAKKSPTVLLRLYRNLLRASKPYTNSKDARVLNCLLHRTGVDDHIHDWEKFVTSDSDRSDGQQQNHVRDLSYGYGESTSNQHPNRTEKVLFRRLLREVVAEPKGLRRMTFPSIVDTSKLEKVIKREFRDTQSSMSRHFDFATRRQVAFTTLRELNRKLSFFDAAQKSAVDASPHQAALHVSALPISTPTSSLQPGCFLLSHPQMNDSFFSRSVICILDYQKEIADESAAKRFEALGQTYGIIVNRVSINAETGKNRTLKEAFDENILPERLADVFGDSVVRDGGPVHVALQMLHALPGSEENRLGGTLIPAIPEGKNSSTAEFSDRATYFQGDVFKAISAVAKGEIESASTWAPGQLENEIAQGYWIPCRGPPEIALTGICDHAPTGKSDKRPVADLWLSMFSACGTDEARLASLFHYHANQHFGQPPRMIISWSLFCCEGLVTCSPTRSPAGGDGHAAQ
eukprot:scaffold22681_cov146-Cylindrotheca_fusiformis.AAC.2